MDDFDRAKSLFIYRHCGPFLAKISRAIVKAYDDVAGGKLQQKLRLHMRPVGLVVIKVLRFKEIIYTCIELYTHIYIFRDIYNCIMYMYIYICTFLGIPLCGVEIWQQLRITRS